MTEYEATSIFYILLNTSFTLMLGYVSILSAFLVMSYFAAAKLSPILQLIVIVLFTLVCLMIITQINLIRNDITEIYLYLFELKGAGATGLQWFGSNPFWVVNLLTVLVNLVTFGGYAGSIAFFLFQKSSREA